MSLQAFNSPLSPEEKGVPMATNLFVGNLPYNMDDARLTEVFAQAGTVTSAKVIKDKYSGRSRGFGFVEMSSDEESKKAIEMLNGKDIDGRPLVVNEARPPKTAQA
jgi:cold-inducible RNA-binding protein